MVGRSRSSGRSRRAISPWLVKVGMTSSSVATLRSVRKSVLGSTVAGSIPRYLSTAGVATRSCDSARYCLRPPGPSNRLASSIAGITRVSPRTNGRASGCTTLRSGITVARSSWWASCRTLAARRPSCASASTGRELARIRWAEIHPDLSVGKRGRLGRRLRLLCRGGDDHGRRDPESERDRSERRSGTGLVAGQVSECQSGCDRDSHGDCGEGANRERAEEEAAHDRRQ